MNNLHKTDSEIPCLAGLPGKDSFKIVTNIKPIVRGTPSWGNVNYFLWYVEECVPMQDGQYLLTNACTNLLSEIIKIFW